MRFSDYFGIRKDFESRFKHIITFASQHYIQDVVGSRLCIFAEGIAATHRSRISKIVQNSV